MIEVNGKKLCENCFSEISQEPCACCGYGETQEETDRSVLQAGTKLNGHILVGKVMGKGGVGVTYLGYDCRMDKVVAVKEYFPNGIVYRSGGTEVLLADVKSKEVFSRGADKFYDEAQMVAQFNGNPNIVSVFEYFRENNTVYLVMEFLDGITLKDYIKKRENLSDGQVLFVFNKMASALSITHSAGVLHRDISPDNIMLCTDGKVKLIDFGAARQIMEESASNLTVVLKPGYTPMEQYTKKGQQGAWTDIYSLGVSLYYARTGILLDDPYERLDNDREFEENRHGINKDLWAILKKCTMISASDRYASAIELKKALASVSAPLRPEPISVGSKDVGKEENGSSGDADRSLQTDEPGEKETEQTGGEPEEMSLNLTADLPVDDSGYDATVNVYKKKGGGNRKKRIAAVCAICAAVVVLLCAVSVFIVGRREKGPSVVIRYETDFGNYGVGNLIPKEKLESIGGDVLVTLEIETGDFVPEEDGRFYYKIRPITGDYWFNVNTKIVDTEIILIDDAGFFYVRQDCSQFSFTVNQNQISRLKGIGYDGEETLAGIWFTGTNIKIRSARLEPAPQSSEVVSYETDFGNNDEGNLISKEILGSIGGDVFATIVGGQREKALLRSFFTKRISEITVWAI